MRRSRRRAPPQEVRAPCPARGARRRQPAHGSLLPDAAPTSALTAAKPFKRKERGAAGERGAQPRSRSAAPAPRPPAPPPTPARTRPGWNQAPRAPPAPRGGRGGAGGGGAGRAGRVRLRGPGCQGRLRHPALRLGLRLPAGLADPLGRDGAALPGESGHPRGRAPRSPPSPAPPCAPRPAPSWLRCCAHPRAPALWAPALPRGHPPSPGRPPSRGALTFARPWAVGPF